MKNKPEEGLMFWQKVGLFVLAAFSVTYIAMWVFPQGEGVSSKNISKKDTPLKINLDRNGYQTEEPIKVEIKNVSRKVIFLQKPCEGLVALFAENEGIKDDWNGVGTYSDKQCKLEFTKLSPDKSAKFIVYPEVYKLLRGNHSYKFKAWYLNEKFDVDEKISRHDLLGMPTVFSEEITINNLLEIDNKKECNADGECELYFSQCDCAFHCGKKGEERRECKRVCDESSIQREMIKCECANEECVESDNVLNSNEIEYIKVKETLNSYFKVEKSCNIDGAINLISKRSQKMVSFTCRNMKREEACNGGATMSVKVSSNEAVAYVNPFSYEKDNPYFFIKEGGEWKLDLYRMANSLTMVGGNCEGWTWRTGVAKDEFCNFFAKGMCPAESIR